MKAPRDELITALAADLRPIGGAGRTTRITLAWLAAAGVFSLLAILAGGPLRPGVAGQLADSPRFAAELVLGVVTIGALVAGAFRLSIPSMRAPTVLVAVPLAMLAAWIGLYVYGLASPSLEPSMAGKRGHCILETALFGLPALVAGMVAARRLWPLHGAWIGFMFGLAAGAIPALIMQFACMYEAMHILTYHLAPGLALGIVGALAGHFLLRPR